MNEIDNLISVTTDEFVEKVIETSKRIPVLVDFWAEWCAPCRTLVPVLEAIAKRYGDKLLIAKVNTDTEQALASEIGVRSLPTLAVFKDGAPVNHIVGAQPEAAIRALIDPHVEKESDRLTDEARAALADGDNEKAVAILRKMKEAEPENKMLQMEIAELLLDHGDMAPAEQILADLPANMRQDPSAKRLKARLSFSHACGTGEDAATLIARVESEPGDLEARYRLGACRILSGDYEDGLEQFLEIMQRDRCFRDDIGWKSMLNAFELIGSNQPIVTRYRRRMAALLH